MPAVQFVPVDARLAGKRWYRFRSFDFAERDLGAVISAPEVSLVASFAPVVFTREVDGYLPYALFALGEERNAFVAPEGHWMGNYVPAQLRSYPFSLSRRANDDAMVVRWDALGDDDVETGIPLISSDGTLSGPLQEVRDFLIKCRVERRATARLLRKVVHLGIFTRSKAGQLRRQGGRDLFIVDWNRVRMSEALSTAIARDLSLQRVLHAHAVSLLQTGRLGALETGRKRRAYALPTPQTDIEDFLDAVGGAFQGE